MDNWGIAGVVIAGVSALFAGLATLVTYRMWRSSSRTQSEEEGKWKGRVDTLLERIGMDLERIGTELAELRRIVFDRLDIPLVISQSPLRLTELGKTVSEEIASQAWVEKVADSLNEKVRGKDAYEIRAFCFKYVESIDQYSKEEQQVIRNTAYERGIKAKDLRQVLAIELRDKLLKNAGLEVPEESQEV